MDSLFKTPEGSHHFFGYYDKSPFDYDNNKLLSQRAAFMDRMPTKDDILEIGYFDWQHGDDFIKLTETKAWNWQQGCMLQWVGPEFNKSIIYNDRINNKFVSVLNNLETKVKTILPMSVYSVHPSGKYALCIDNERHYWFRGGYSYQGIENQSKKLAIDDHDGIWLLNLENELLTQIINMGDLLKVKPLSHMNGAIHYLEHLMFSPSGDRFCFMHRWQLEDGGIYSRLFTANKNGEDLYLLNDSGRMSHYCWRNDCEILAYGGLQNTFSQLRKHKILVKHFVKPLLPLYHFLVHDNSVVSKVITGDSYLLFKDRSSQKTRIYPDILQENGHPTFCPSNQQWFISDTYQDINNNRCLFLFDIENGNKIDIARLRSAPSMDNSGIRCDLHPKWAYSDKFVCVDTVHNGVRQMFIYDLTNIVS